MPTRTTIDIGFTYFPHIRFEGKTYQPTIASQAGAGRKVEIKKLRSSTPSIWVVFNVPGATICELWTAVK